MMVRALEDATHTAVVVLVPEAEPVVAEHRARHDVAAGWGVGAHVTVLYPFVEPTSLDERVIARLGNAVLAVRRFDARLVEPRWFGEEVLWLAPEPEPAFRALTTTVSRAFPDYPPYGGEFDDVVPHLTVGHVGTIEDLRAAERTLGPQLPVAFDVSTVHLLAGREEQDTWGVVAEMPLA